MRGGGYIGLKAKDEAGTYPARWHFEAALMNLMPPKNALSALGQLLSCVYVCARAYECACACVCESHNCQTHSAQLSARGRSG